MDDGRVERWRRRKARTVIEPQAVLMCKMAEAMREFILVRLAEDEMTANAAADVGGKRHARWIVAWGHVVAADDPDNRAIMTETTPEIHAHVARFDPLRALRQAAVLREVVNSHRLNGVYAASDLAPEPLAWCRCGELWPCSTFHWIAAIWNEHEDYEPGLGDARMAA